MSKTEYTFQSLWSRKGGSLNYQRKVNKQDRQKQILLQILASLNQYGQVCTNSDKFVLIQTSLEKFEPIWKVSADLIQFGQISVIF